MDGTLRTVVESPLFAQQKAAIEPNARRMDDILDAVGWGLSTNPEQFFRVWGNKRIWLAKTDRFPDAPRLRIWYMFDSQVVTLLSIEVIADDEGL